MRRSEVVAEIRGLIAASEPEVIALVRKEYEREGNLDRFHFEEIGFTIRNVMYRMASEQGFEIPLWMEPDSIWESVLLEALGYGAPTEIPLWVQLHLRDNRSIPEWEEWIR
jgi:hypothetical protein